MSLVIKSKQILTATLIVALGAAVMVNWYYTNSGDMVSDSTTTNQSVSGNLGDTLYVAGTTLADTSESTQEDVSAMSSDINDDEYFAEAKLKRTESYDEIVEEIEDLLSGDVTDSALQEKIQTMLSEFERNLKAQTDTENLIKAKTSSECLVVINENTCQVILEKNTLNDTIVLQITEIIEKNTNISAENLTIIELK